MVYLFASFVLKCERTSAFKLNPFAHCFSFCLESDQKIVPLCYKHIIAMNSRKIREKYR